MPQDAFTLRYLCEELNGIFSEGKVNRITQPTADSSVFTVFTKKGVVKKLLLDVSPSSPRIGVIEEEPEQTILSSNFNMLLKKHLLSATLKGISMVGFDRIVKIDFLPSAEIFDAPPKTLYVELMGRYSNVILTENGVVLGGNRGINSLDNNVRPLICGRKYVLPPVGDKKQPWDTSLKETFSGFSGDVSAMLCANVQGIAPSTAKEIETKYFGKFEEYDGDKFFAFLNDYLFNTPLCPCTVTENGEIKDVMAYPYENLSGEKTFFDTLYLAEEKYFGAKSTKKAFGELYTRLLSKTETAIKKAKKRLAAITAREKDAASAEENKIKADIILSNVHKIPAGADETELFNYYDGTTLKISLDKRLSAAQNAQNYYKKYAKQKRAKVALLSERETAEKELDYLTGVSEEIRLAESTADLKAVREELAVAGIIKDNAPRRGKKETKTFARTYEIDGFRVKAGRNNVENDQITFSAKPNDIWLHAKDYHSSHVVIETDGKKAGDKTLIAAAEICAYYSKGREGGKTEIVYTERKNVKKPPKSKLGFCTYVNFKSVTVKPDPHLSELK